MTIAITYTLTLSSLLLSGVTLCGQSAAGAPPDFSGVYYPIMGRPVSSQAPRPTDTGGTPPKPRASAPLADGSLGRGPNAPELTPEYLAKWQQISKARIAGNPIADNSAKCLPLGMPSMMVMFYGMEVMQTKDKITFFSELNDVYRRAYLDGRKASQKVLDDPTYAGYSTGHWEGDTLVIDTVGIREESPIQGFAPSSGEMTTHERIHINAAGLLEDEVTVNDPKALVKPWSTVFRYRKAKPGNDELREFACAEGLAEAK